MKPTYLFAILFSVLCTSNGFAQYSLEEAFPDLASFSRPIEYQTVPNNTDRFIVVEERGKVWIMNYSDTVSTKRLFFDLSKTVAQLDNEVGLLGVAFDPNYVQNHYIYFSYDTGSPLIYYSLIVRYTVSTSTPDTIIPSSAVTILTFAQPPTFPNHKGGCLRFGPDGNLYASFGDGGSGGDPYKNGQNTSTFLGKILCLDVAHPSGGNNYGIPTTNPFVGDNSGKKKEIYAYGLRNVWRFSFDPMGDALWAGDVGQDLWEEVDIIKSGNNYGWNIMEGTHCYPPTNTNCDTTGLTKPIWEYYHDNGNVSITGGYVYRGFANAPLFGKYIYADYGTGRIWSLAYEGNTPPFNELLIDKATPAYNVTAFGVDKYGEILPIVWTNNGNVGRIMRLISSESSVHDLKPGALGLKMTLRPNPFTDETTISISSERPLTNMTLTDALGHVTILSPKQEMTLSAAEHGLVPGMYLLRVSNGEATITKKIICVK